MSILVFLSVLLLIAALGRVLGGYRVRQQKHTLILALFLGLLVFSQFFLLISTSTSWAPMLTGGGSAWLGLAAGIAACAFAFSDRLTPPPPASPDTHTAEMLREREAQLARAIRITQMGTWTWDLEENTQTWSDETFRIFGLEPRAITPSADAFQQIIHPDDFEHVRTETQQSLGDGTKPPLEYRIVYPDGEIRYIRAVTGTYHDTAGKPIRMEGTVMDITEHKRAQQTLIAAESRLRSVINHASVILWALDTNGVFVLSEGKGLEALNLKPGQLVGQSALEIYADYPEVKSMIQKALNQESITMQLVLEDLVYQAFYSPQFDANGKFINTIGVALDITDRVRVEAEREHLIAELEAKNTELERFTYTVSHDLKSPLVTIKGFLGLLEKDIRQEKPGKIEVDIKHIREATARMERLLDELLELSRIGRLVTPSSMLSATVLAQEATDLVAGQIEARGVEVNIAPDLPNLYGDPMRLVEVYQNLLDNAVKFMGDQPNPRIEIGWRDEPNPVLYICDNGIGIDPLFQDKVFGLFDRLNVEVEGTGIGLTLVKRIVEVHGGRVWIESKGEGHGTCVCFTLSQAPSSNKPT